MDQSQFLNIFHFFTQIFKYFIFFFKIWIIPTKINEYLLFQRGIFSSETMCSKAHRSVWVTNNNEISHHLTKMKYEIYRQRIKRRNNAIFPRKCLWKSKSEFVYWTVDVQTFWTEEEYSSQMYSGLEFAAKIINTKKLSARGKIAITHHFISILVIWLFQLFIMQNKNTSNQKPSSLQTSKS